MDAALVVADLTDSNANVFYELAIRHMIRKPYIQIMLKSQDPPFDVSAVRTFPFNHLDLDEAQSAREALAEQIEAVKDQEEVESPISAAIDLDKLSKSDKPEQRQIADLLKGFTILQNQVSKLEQTIVTNSYSASFPNLARITGTRVEVPGRINVVMPEGQTFAFDSETPVSLPRVPVDKPRETKP